MWLPCAWPSQVGAESYVFGSDKRQPGYSVAMVPAAAQVVLCSGDPSAGFQWVAALMPIRTTWMARTPLSRTVHEYFPFQQTSITCTLAAHENIYIHAYILMCTHTYIHTYIRTYAHTSICMYIHTCTCIHIYIHKCILIYDRKGSEWVSGWVIEWVRMRTSQILYCVI
jgi:hypothetical protein